MQMWYSHSFDQPDNLNDGFSHFFKTSHKSWSRAPKLKRRNGFLPQGRNCLGQDKCFLAPFIGISDYAMRTDGQVADRYQWEKISQIPFLGDLAKTSTAGTLMRQEGLSSILIVFFYFLLFHIKGGSFIDIPPRSGVDFIKVGRKAPSICTLRLHPTF